MGGARHARHARGGDAAVSLADFLRTPEERDAGRQMLQPRRRIQTSRPVLRAKSSPDCILLFPPSGWRTQIQLYWMVIPGRHTHKVFGRVPRRAVRSGDGLEQFDRIAVRVLEQDLLATDAGDDVVAEPGSCSA